MRDGKILTWAVAVCLLITIGASAQSSRQGGARTPDAAPAVLRPVEPDSPGTSSPIAASSQAVVPPMMKFSGALRDVTGKPLSGTVDVTFALYSTEVGGTPLWFETQTVQADELGRYTALLGAMHTEGLPIDLFTSGQVRWLGIQVGLEAEQQPLTLLVSVPYALKAGDAETLGGKPASAYMLAESQSGTTSSIANASIPGTIQTGSTGKAQNSRTANTTALVACASVTSDGSAIANSIALFTSACNVEGSMILQSGGNVGIGTTTPTSTLQVSGFTTSDADALYNIVSFDNTPAAAGTGGGIAFAGYYSGTSSAAGFANIRGVKENSTQGDYASTLIFDTRASGGNQSERMRITSVGNVGIGTTTPSSTLQVSGLTSSDADARYNIMSFDNTPAATGTGGGVSFAGFYSGTSLAAGFANIRGVKENSTQGDYASSLIFDTRANGGNQSERMRITSAGNVGIGTSTPAATLEVNGTAQFDGLVTFAQPIASPTGAFTGSNASQVLSVTQTGAGSAAVVNSTAGGNILVGQNNGTQEIAVNATGGLTLGTGAPAAQPGSVSAAGSLSAENSVNVDGGGTNSGLFNNGATTGNGLTFGALPSGEGIASKRTAGGNQSGLDFYTGSTNRMSITSSGRIGVGTTNPTATLHVSGVNSFDGDARYNIVSFDQTPAAPGSGGGIAFAGYYSGISLAAGFAGIRGVKENLVQGDYASALIFDTRANGGLQAERMRITSAGFVGLGTSAPIAMLDVAGAINALGATFTGNSISGTQVLNLVQKGNGTGLNVIKNGTSGTGAAVFAPAGGTAIVAQGGTAVNASSNAPSGIAVRAAVSSASASAGSFQNSAGGTILAGFGSGTSPVFRLDGTGKGFFDGGTQTGGADFAESVAVLGKHSQYEPGDLLVIDSTGNRRLALSSKPYSTMVAGIYSTKPGVLATPHIMDDSKLKEEVPLAVVGIVPCKVTAQNGPIQVGDLLVSSSLPGYAMKGKNRSRMLGAVVGKALEPLDQGTGVIQVLVTLQ